MAVKARATVPVLAALALVSAAAGAPPTNPSGATLPDHVPGEILVGFSPGITEARIDGIRSTLGAGRRARFRSGARHWALPPGLSVEVAIGQLRATPGVRYAEPDYLIQPLMPEVLPDDPLFGEQYSLRNESIPGCTDGADIDAPAAWAITRGSREVIVAVLDSGLNYLHEDIAPNAWINEAERDGLPGIDDDGCGYVDDVRGYDWSEADADPLYTNPDFGIHGTWVAGIAGAAGDNGTGISGVSLDVTLLPARILPSFGPGRVTVAIEAIEYVTCLGADIINASWGLGPGVFSQALKDAIEEAGAREVLFVAAAGNNSYDNDDPNTAAYPASYDLDNVISVASTDCNDLYSWYTNYGAASVDLAAPGEAILAAAGTDPNTGLDIYRTVDGTSFSSPHVAGVAAMIRSINPSIPAVLAKARILDSVDPILPLAGVPRASLTDGRLNAAGAVSNLDRRAPHPIEDLRVTSWGETSVSLAWTATGDDRLRGRAALYELRHDLQPLAEENFLDGRLSPAVPVPAEPGEAEDAVVKGLCPATTYHFLLEAYDEWGNGAVSNPVSRATDPPSCRASYCRDDGSGGLERCSLLSSLGPCGCCDYTCLPDPACGAAESPPAGTCP